MKRLTASVMVIVMMMLLIAGCGKSDEAPINVPSQDEGGTGNAEETLEGSLITASPTTFSIFLNFNNMPFDPEWEVWQEVAERTNISLEGVISKTNANEEEAFNLMLSSGDLADVIGYKNVADLEKLGRDGGLTPLNTLIDEHAPNIKALLESDPKFKQGATALDGNIYYIPLNQNLLSAEFYWIRHDWLDKLGLEVPTTVEDLYNVLTAFRNEDPNGNGKKDEIPLFDRAGHKMPDEYLYLFDSSTEFYSRDGIIEFEPLEENFVYGVRELAKWYQEGLIDPEIFTRGAKSRDTLYSGNLGGFTHDWPSAGNYNSSLANEIPGFNNVAIAPMENQNGDIVERTTRYTAPGWGISSQCEDPVTLIKFFDYFFTEEGSDLINWGIEGKTYTVDEAGNKMYTEEVLGNTEQTPLGYLRSFGAQYRIGMNQDPNYEYAFMTPEAKAAAELYNSHPEWYRDDVPPYFDGQLNLKYTDEDEAEYKRIMSQIRPYVDEMFQKWMLGASNIDEDYETFVQELKNRNIDRAIEINQKALDTFLGK